MKKKCEKFVKEKKIGKNKRILERNKIAKD